MLIKTWRAELVWVDWPPIDAAEVWCRGPAPNGGARSTVYRLVDGAWVESEWGDSAAGPMLPARLH